MSTAQIFTGLAENYRKYRPSYPDAALALLKKFSEPLPCTAKPPAIVDVGTGTGILLRQLQDTFGPNARYIGVEPGHDMLEKARADNASAQFIASPAESISLSDSYASLITAAQALHWFDRKKFYGEVQRLLLPGATLAILYNDRDTRDPFVAAYERFLGVSNATDDTRGTGRAGLGITLLREGVFQSELSSLQGFANPAVSHHSWQRRMTADDFVSMCFSTVQMQNVVAVLGNERAVSALRSLIAAHAPSGSALMIPYITTLIATKHV